jgi:drug/metabolite transporter (DMT)-like permease
MTLFAANSLLARFALRTNAIDAGSFAAVRIVSGAAALALLLLFRREPVTTALKHGSWRATIALSVYAFVFAYAYLSLSAGTGALVMFATVQITMLGVGIARGHRPKLVEWIGLALAFGGLLYLASPGITAPSPTGVLLMAASGVAWGCYSLAARGVRSPAGATAGNFMGAVPFALAAILCVWTAGQAHATWHGIVLAAISGAISSGLGYTIWYAAAKNLTPSLAAIVQLTVPVLTATAGVLLLGEQLTWRLLLSSCAILGGVALALLG